MCESAKAVVQPLRHFSIQIIHMTLCPLKLTMEFAISRHSEVGLRHEEETEDQEGSGDSHSEAGRLLQESEESRHAVTDQRHQEVTAETAPSHRRGGYTATRTHLGNPEDAS